MNAVEALAQTVAAADAVVAVGAGTQLDIGGVTPSDATEVRAPAGVVSYEPADMTVTVFGGTPVHLLDAALSEHGQECPLDPREPRATVGGVLAAGLSGHRRLRYGPVRDRVLEVRFLTGDGRVVRGGGPTVKNVTGYDLPRLLVGSLGTLGVIVQVTLRTQPRAATSAWSVTDETPDELRARLFRPACLAWDGCRTHVLLEGHPEDVAAEQVNADLEPVDLAPRWPEHAHRGRASVRPGVVAALATRLRDVECTWIAEGGVGTLPHGADTESGLADARGAVEAESGWMLREAGAPGLDPFGIPLANLAVMTRIKDAFDPAGKLNPGRLPYARSAA
ncbi:MAG: FAD-binding protein [Acidimicrobiia bacterium]